MMLIILVFGLFNFFFGEKILLNEGLGWDGARYAEIVRRLPEMIELGQLNSYYAQRVAPLLIVRWLLMAMGYSLDPANHIIRAFEIYNLVLLLAICWLWHDLLKSIGLESRWRWFAFLSLFFSYEGAKQGFYYPVLTDITALLISVLLLRFYLSARPFAVLITTVIGAFVWPFATVVGACLILFPVPDTVAKHADAHRSEQRSFGVYLFFLWAAVLVACIAIYTYMTSGDVEKSLECTVPDVITTWFGGPTVPCTWTAFITGIPSVLVTAAASLALLVTCLRRWPIAAMLRAMSVYRIGLAAAAIVLPYAIVRLISNPALKPPSGIRALMEFMLLPPAGKFLLPFVTLGVFWGPMFLVLILCWPRVSNALNRLGPGIAISVALSLPLGLANEPRFLTLAWPFCVTGGLFALRQINVGKPFTYAFSILTLASAQFWLPLNRLPWEPIDTIPKSDALTPTYYMHYGLWMDWAPYCVQGICIIAALFWLNKLILRATIDAGTLNVRASAHRSSH